MTCVEATPLVSRARLTTRRAAHSVWCHTAQEMTWMLPRKRVSLFEPPPRRASPRGASPLARRRRPVAASSIAQHDEFIRAAIERALLFPSHRIARRRVSLPPPPRDRRVHERAVRVIPPGAASSPRLRHGGPERRPRRPAQSNRTHARPVQHAAARREPRRRR